MVIMPPLKIGSRGSRCDAPPAAGPSSAGGHATRRGYPEITDTDRFPKLAL